MLTLIYVLRLEGGKYHVGKSDNLNVDLLAHCRSFLPGEKGTEWTKVHKFEAIAEVAVLHDASDVDTMTKRYMQRYGIENVRGGSYEAVVLPDDVLQGLVMTTGVIKLHGGHNNHETESCYARADMIGQPLPSVLHCTRCDRDGHKTESCYALTDKSGQSLPDALHCDRCYRDGHGAETCYARTNKFGQQLPHRPVNLATVVCFRCTEGTFGKERGHFAPDCPMV